jgi:DNA helicase-2/ATP-dependent DNA helicase PcrA
LDACNGVINLSRQAYAKKLWSQRASKIKPRLVTVQDEAEQAKYIADEVLRAKEEGVPFSSQAVLMRASHHSLKLEIELSRRNIPFVKWGGIKFLEAAHIKDVLSVLRWCENPRDEIAGFRVLKLLPGVGPGIATKVLKQLKQWPGALDIDRVKAPHGAAENWPGFVKLMAALRTAEWPMEVSDIVKWYFPLMKHDNADLRAADLGQLSLIAGTYQSRQKFLMEVTLEPPEGTVGPRKNARPDDDDYLVLSTIHSAKGQEWSRVTILNAVNGAIPSTKATSPDDVEEERRLLYVAMTRAKDILELIIPHRFLSYRDNSPIVDLFSSPTRFIPASFIRYFKRKTAGGRKASHGVREHVSKVP